MAGFAECCPYFRPSSLDRPALRDRPMFRLEERFSDFSGYIGDSLGDRSYIDTSMTRDCPEQCRCRRLNTNAGSNDFSFQVQKTEYGVKVILCSRVLQLYLSRLLFQQEDDVYAMISSRLQQLLRPGMLVQERSSQSKIRGDIDGFYLLKNLDTLERRLQELRAEMQGSSPSHSLFRTLKLSGEDIAQFEAELSLLVEGLVADDQVFESFGHEKLYEKGFLTYDRWKSFRESKTLRSLDQLDWATCINYHQPEGDEDFRKMGSDDLTELLEELLLSWPSPNTTWPRIVSPVNDKAALSRILRGNFDRRQKRIHTEITLRQGSRRPSMPTVREDCLKTIRIRYLHHEFRRQHTHISECARASTNLRGSPPREGPHCSAWGDVFDYNYSKAWSRGIAVMRGLCRGEAPSNLYDTIMFLAMGKAICLSKIGSSLSDQHAEFLADLGRWQVLFHSDKRSLSAFRNAVSDIWHVSAEELDRNHLPYSMSLVHFQELAMSLITNVEQSFDHQRDLGNELLASQERWGWNRVPEMSETQRPEPFDMQFPENMVERGKSTESDTPGSTASGKTDVSQSPETQIPLRAAIHNDSRLRTCNTVVILLMAGFVFSVVLVFLKELQHGPLLPTLLTSNAYDFYSSVHLPAILQGAVHHLCVIVKNEFAPNVLEKVENTLNSAIQQGHIASFSDLTRFIKAEDLVQTCSEPSLAIKIQNSLLAAYSIWQPSYDLQERYHNLQTYLGLKDYESIVPHAIHLTPPAEEPDNVRDGFSRLNSQTPSITFSSPHSQFLESNSSAPTAPCSSDIEMEMQLPSRHDMSQFSHGNPQQMLDSTPPPRQQPPVPHTGYPSDGPQAKTYCKECNRDFKIVGNYNKHRKDIHERVRFACRCPPCQMTYSRKNYRDIHERNVHGIGPA